MNSTRLIPPTERIAMQVSYAIACRPLDQCGYSPCALGTTADYYFTMEKDSIITAKDIVASRLKEMKKEGITEPLRLLDLGCGHGGFVKAVNAQFKGEVKATGITAFCADQSDPSVVQGNIDFLFDINGVKPNSYDVVVSRNALPYVANPGLCTLQAYDALRPNGYLILDCIPLWGLTLAEHKEVAANLHSLHPPRIISMGGIVPGIQGVLLRKDDQPLELPLDYAGTYIDPLRALKIKYAYKAHGNINEKLAKESKSTTVDITTQLSAKTPSPSPASSKYDYSATQVTKTSQPNTTVNASLKSPGDNKNIPAELKDALENGGVSRLIENNLTTLNQLIEIYNRAPWIINDALRAGNFLEVINKRWLTVEQVSRLSQEEINLLIHRVFEKDLQLRVLSYRPQHSVTNNLEQFGFYAHSAPAPTASVATTTLRLSSTLSST